MRFLHAADLHLDSPPTGVGEVHPTLSATVRDASLLAFDRLVEIALSEEVDVCLFAGDIHEGSRHGLRAQVRFRDGLARLADAGVRSFVVQGNHDPLSEGWTAVRSWPSGVTVFGSEPSTIGLEVRGEPVSVSGVSYRSRHEPGDLSATLRCRPADGFHIGLLHSEADRGNAGDRRYAPAPAGALANGTVHYWALGHVHRGEVRNHHGCWIAHPGCTQGRRFSAGELGPKGVLVGDVVGGSLAGPPRFLCTDVVRMAEPTLDVSEVVDPAGLLDAVAGAARAEATAAEGRAVLAGIRLVGRGEAHRSIAERPGEVLAEARHRCWDHGVWLCHIEDCTGPPIDLRARAEDSDLLGVALAELDLLDPRDLLTALPAGAGGALDAHALTVARHRAAVALADLLGGAR